jgi:hypothetical protein
MTAHSARSPIVRVLTSRVEPNSGGGLICSVLSWRTSETIDDDAEQLT